MLDLVGHALTVEDFVNPQGIVVRGLVLVIFDALVGSRPDCGGIGWYDDRLDVHENI